MTNNHINDGGPAFPNVPSDPGYSQWEQGMTLRDWFARQDSLKDLGDLNNMQLKDAVPIAVAIAGPHPSGEDPLAWVEWWARVRARLKYIRADAMLKAREVNP